MKRIRAFTLIELLVVIAIIAILAAILFPVFAQAKLAAKKTVDLSQVKQLGLGNNLYGDSFDDFMLSFPYADTWSDPPIEDRRMGPYWSDRLMPYVKSKQIFADSSNKMKLFDTKGYWKPGWTNADPNLPANKTGVYRVTYALNHMVCRADKPPLQAGAANISAISDPARVTLLGPGQWPYSFSACQPDTPGSNNMNYVWLISEMGADWGYELWGSTKLKAGGYNEGANFAYTDGHAAYCLAVKGDTVGKDRHPGRPKGLFWGYFPKAITCTEVSNDGICPGGRSELAY